MSILTDRRQKGHTVCKPVQGNRHTNADLPGIRAVKAMRVRMMHVSKRVWHCDGAEGGGQSTVAIPKYIVLEYMADDDDDDDGDDDEYAVHCVWVHGSRWSGHPAA